MEDKNVSKVCQCLDNYISEEIEIIQLALFFMKDTTILNKSKDVINILIKYDIHVFFVETHYKEENISLEKTNFFKNIKSFISKNFNDNKEKILLYKGKAIYIFIRINQKKKMMNIIQLLASIF